MALQERYAIIADCQGTRRAFHVFDNRARRFESRDWINRESAQSHMNILAIRAARGIGGRHG
mgnify:CR=1 FL=1